MNDWRRRGAHTRLQALALGIALLVTVLVTACSSGTAATATTPTPGGTTITPGATAAPTAASTITPIGTSPAQSGAGDICASTKSVTAQPPANIPPYPNAELHISQTGNGGSLFGYCSGAAVGDIAAFYTQQLPAQGWSKTEMHPLGDYRQVTAMRGSVQLVITILPSTVANTTDILIVTQGQ